MAPRCTPVHGSEQNGKRSRRWFLSWPGALSGDRRTESDRTGSTEFAMHAHVCLSAMSAARSSNPPLGRFTAASSLQQNFSSAPLNECWEWPLSLLFEKKKSTRLCRLHNQRHPSGRPARCQEIAPVPVSSSRGGEDFAFSVLGCDASSQDIKALQSQLDERAFGGGWEYGIRFTQGQARAGEGRAG